MPRIFIPLVLCGALFGADLTTLLQYYDHSSPHTKHIELESRQLQSEGEAENALDAPALELEQGTLATPGSSDVSISRVGLSMSLRMPHHIGDAMRTNDANRQRAAALAEQSRHEGRLNVALAYHTACLAKRHLSYRTERLEQERKIHGKIHQGINVGAYPEYERLLVDMELAKQTLAAERAEAELSLAMAELKSALLGSPDVSELTCNDLAPLTPPQMAPESADPMEKRYRAEERYQSGRSGLTGGFSTFELGAGQEKEGDDERVTLALSLPLGFMGAASKEAELARIRALQAQSFLSRYQSERGLRIGALDDELRLLSRSLQTASDTLIPAAQAYADMMSRRYTLGGGTLQELYRARAEATAVTLDELELLKNYYTLLFERYRYTDTIDYRPFRSQQ